MSGTGVFRLENPILSPLKIRAQLSLRKFSQ